jgi:V/A-type H+-transporting ATPase subunit F
VEYFFLGEAELLTAFRFVGINGMAVNNSDEAAAAFRKITESSQVFASGSKTIDIVLPDSFPGADSCHVVIVTEEVADWLGDLMIEWQLSGKYPLLVEIPGLAGKLAGRKTLVESIREAVGINV